jgi:hypothetical protein
MGSTRSYEIPSHLRSFTLSYLDSRDNEYEYHDHISVSPIRGLTSHLRDFGLRGCESFTVCLDALSTCVHLERVTLDHLDSASSLGWVWGLRELTHLDLGRMAVNHWLGCDIPESTCSIQRLSLRRAWAVQDLTGILRMPQLTRVDLQQLTELYTVHSLGMLRQLQTLTISFCGCLPMLPMMNKLSTLRLEACDNLLRDCGYLDTCPNLCAIELVGMDEMKSFGLTAPLTQLESLTLVKCRSLWSVRIPRSVRHLHITGCRALSYVEWSTSPVDADSHTLNIVKDRHGDYTLE